MQLEISNSFVIKNCDKGLISALKSLLTLDNPAYEKVKRYSRYAYTRVPKFLTYYQARGNEIEIPIGIDLSKISFDKIADERVWVSVKYPKFVLELRQHQKEAVRKYVEKNVTDCGIVNRFLVQLATGKGKSILGIYLASLLCQRTLIVVHKDDLVKGWQDDIKLAFNGELKSGLIKAKKFEIGEQITIATIQTLSKLPEETFNSLLDKFGFVITDECLVGDTLIVTEDGGVLPIKRIKDSDRVFCGGEVSHSFVRESPIYAVKFKSGILEGSPTHLTACVDKRKYYVPSKKECIYENVEFEYKRLKEIDSNYLIPVKIQIPHTVKNSVSPISARFAACIMCDGHLDKTQGSKRVKINVDKDRDFYTEVFSEGCKHFGVKMRKSLDCRGNLTLWSTDMPLKQHLIEDWKIPVGKKSNKITIPDWLFYSPLPTIKAFIETCFNCEGDLSGDERNKNTSYRINFNSCSKQFVLGLSLLLRKFGILASYQEISRKSVKHNNTYRLSIGGTFFNKFMETFKLIDRKYTEDKNTMLNYHSHFIVKVNGEEYYLSRVSKSYLTNRIAPVYDFTTETHHFVANGALTHNCHHTPSTTFSVIDKFKARYRLGLTATPERSDGLTPVLKFYFGGFCYKYKSTENDEDILPVEVMRVPIYEEYEPKVSGNKAVYNIYDFDVVNAGLKNISDIPFERRPKVSYMEIDNAVVLHNLKEYAKYVVFEYEMGRSCLVFFNKKEQCRIFRDYLIKECWVDPDSIGLYYGDNKDNDSVKREAEAKRKYITIATYSKATEGTNVVQWEVAFLIGSLNNGKNVEQAIGRIRRRSKDKEKKLWVAKVYDFDYLNTYVLRNHYATRRERYLKLHFTVKPFLI